MTPAKERLKKVADRLSEDDAAIVLVLARKLARRRRNEDRDAEDERLIREALAEPGEISLEESLARRGL